MFLTPSLITENSGNNLDTAREAYFTLKVTRETVFICSLLKKKKSISTAILRGNIHLVQPKIAFIHLLCACLQGKTIKRKKLELCQKEMWGRGGQFMQVSTCLTPAVNWAFSSAFTVSMAIFLIHKLLYRVTKYYLIFWQMDAQSQLHCQIQNEFVMKKNRS